MRLSVLQDLLQWSVNVLEQIQEILFVYSLLSISIGVDEDLVSMVEG